MNDNSAPLLGRLPQGRVMIVFIVVLALGVGAYYAFLGIRYSNARGSLTSLQAVLQDYRKTDPGYVSRLEEYLASQESRQRAVSRAFHYPTTDQLTSAVTDAMGNADVEVRSVAVGTAEAQIVDEVAYDVRSITVTLSGEWSELRRAILLLNRAVTVGVVRGLTLSDLETWPTARIQFMFYLSPARPSESGKGAP